jgi:hypothetical protein
MAKAGGGIGSNKLVRPGVRTGAGREGIRPGHAGQIGTALGNHTTDGTVRGSPVEPMTLGAQPISAKLGNEVALNVGRGGPGAGRDVHRSGSQATHGAGRKP